MYVLAESKPAKGKCAQPARTQLLDAISKHVHRHLWGTATNVLSIEIIKVHIHFTTKCGNCFIMQIDKEHITRSSNKTVNKLGFNRDLRLSLPQSFKEGKCLFTFSNALQVAIMQQQTGTRTSISYCARKTFFFVIKFKESACTWSLQLSTKVLT